MLLKTVKFPLTVAKMTATIRRFQEHMEKFPRDKRIKVELKELIDKRKKFLKYLRRWDYKRFEWILEKLDLVFKPHPPAYHWITRKESLVKLTNIHCDELRTEKLESFKKTLKSQQIDFLEKKVKNLQFIRKEQIACNVPVTITEEDISRESAKLEELRKEEAAAASQGASID